MSPDLRLIASPACYSVLYPELVKVAREHGYALAIHGSMTRDFDLIAVPWVEEASEALKLAHALKEKLQGVFVHSDTDSLYYQNGHPTQKPHGRVCYSIHLTEDGCLGPYIDLSVMPKHE